MDGRIHRSIELMIDQFAAVCRQRLTELGIEKSVWVTKDMMDSVINIGDPDKIAEAKDFGFSMPYETVLASFSDAYEEFEFKLQHFIKVSQTMGKFRAFRPRQDQAE